MIIFIYSGILLRQEENNIINYYYGLRLGH